MSVLRVTLLSPHAHTPTYGSSEAAGLDVCASADTVIAPFGRALVPTGLAIELPRGTYGHLLPRSGLAVKHGIHVGAGVIDSDYRGEVKALLFNFGDQPFAVRAGDRIAQLVVKSYERVTVAVSETLSDTERGANGFGSTGVSYFS
jgi:dUTP pyrophosphatase